MQAQYRTMLFAVLACALGASTAADTPAPGATKQSAIEVCKPAGQREYLSRLVCPGGEAATFHRTGSYGMRNELPADASDKMLAEEIEKSMSFAPHAAGAPDYHVVDGYEVSCGEDKRMIYMDMYHCGRPALDTAPAGLTLRAAASR